MILKNLFLSMIFAFSLTSFTASAAPSFTLENAAYFAATAVTVHILFAVEREKDRSDEPKRVISGLAALAILFKARSSNQIPSAFNGLLAGMFTALIATK